MGTLKGNIMRRTVMACALAIAGTTALAVTLGIPETYSAEKKAVVQIDKKTLRTVAPNRGKLVPGRPKFMTLAASKVVCCTHWNTSTGGTGCATYPDICPDNTFTVECGDDGCW
jgi:hypothetical protein